jgi:hypothetical protein
MILALFVYQAFSFGCQALGKLAVFQAVKGCMQSPDWLLK